MADQKSANQPVTTAASTAAQSAKAVALQANKNGGAPVASGTPQIVINVPTGGTKEGPADILNGIAAVLWPLVLAVIVIMFRDQIISLARRIRKGKAFGAEAEFEKELGALNREANKAKEETIVTVELGTEEQPQPPSGDATEQQPEDQQSSGATTDEVHAGVLAETARSPRLGLMLLSAEIDKLAGRIAASTGNHERRTLRAQLDLWGTQLPRHTSAAYRLFSHVRNRIVHGRDASEAEILSAIDSGLALYDALASIPIERNVVAHPGVEIFGDAAATQPLEGKGLIIETTHEGNKTFRIFPTTKTYFKRGMRLTWEWNMSRVWGAAWYRDPETDEIKEAWGSSAEFVGRDLDQI